MFLKDFSDNVIRLLDNAGCDASYIEEECTDIKKVFGVEVDDQLFFITIVPE
jgi:hypothetical protein